MFHCEGYQGYLRTQEMQKGLIRVIIILPGTVLVVIPALILLVTRGLKFSSQILAPSQILFWSSLLTASLGFALSVWTVRIFVRLGQGTPAPGILPKSWSFVVLIAMLEIR